MGEIYPPRRLINTEAFMIDSKYDAIRAHTAFFTLFWENPLKFIKFFPRFISHVDNNIEQYFTRHTFPLLYLFFGYVGLGRAAYYFRSFILVFSIVLSKSPSLLSHLSLIHFSYEYTVYRQTWNRLLFMHCCSINIQNSRIKKHKEILYPVKMIYGF